MPETHTEAPRPPITTSACWAEVTTATNTVHYTLIEQSVGLQPAQQNSVALQTLPLVHLLILAYKCALKGFGEHPLIQSLGSVNDYT